MMPMGRNGKYRATRNQPGNKRVLSAVYDVHIGYGDSKPASHRRDVFRADNSIRAGMISECGLIEKVVST